MIEAVNSVLQTAPFVRASNEQISTADSFAANPDRVQKAPQAPYISPYVHMDVNFDKAVLQLRNSDTGDVEDQFPSQNQLEAQARSAARRQVEQQQAYQPRAQQTQSAQAPVPQASPDKAEAPPPVDSGSNITQQQQAAFAAAAKSGNSNAGHITLFA